LKFWKNNPRVDYLIGLKLSQKYRFAEGAAHQRQALSFDRDYLPAKGQLAQDLLRLGDETEGWRLAQIVQKQDAYDVEAYNLANLHDAMNKFTAVTNDDFLVRMSPQEAAIYGSRVLDLLSRAKTNLCAKYGMELKRPTIVEVFPEQKDFAVRTFGMPGNSGYLGVCFGQVVTANSPAVHMGHPVNWEAVLYHEFCHVVTLQMTRNKMPRWLSEGISVYEETQANPSWGQRMTPGYREMVLGDELTPVSRLSAAFLAPPSETHLQFAYYESSLVVEFIIQRYGIEKLKAVLRDLGDGTEINLAIAKHTAPMEEIEADFNKFARERAEKLGPGLDWTKPDFLQAAKSRRGGRRGRTVEAPTNQVETAAAPQTSDEAWARWATEHPTNYWAMSRQAGQWAEEKKWTEAKPVLKQLVDLYPDSTGPESAYWLLAAAHRSLGETNEERQVLTRFATEDDEAADAYIRLAELGVESGDWAGVALNADRYLAVNPLVLPPYRFRAQAAEKTEDRSAAIESYRAMLQLNPPDPAEVHFRLASLLHQANDPEARIQVLKALEEAPRYRPALRLLLEINHESGRAGKSVEARR
jgi:tetratricopeptide (TPR) repeat protein